MPAVLHAYCRATGASDVDLGVVHRHTNSGGKKKKANKKPTPRAVRHFDFLPLFLPLRHAGRSPQRCMASRMWDRWCQPPPPMCTLPARVPTAGDRWMMKRSRMHHRHDPLCRPMRITSSQTNSSCKEALARSPAASDRSRWCNGVSVPARLSPPHRRHDHDHPRTCRVHVTAVPLSSLLSIKTANGTDWDTWVGFAQSRGDADARAAACGAAG